MGPQNRATFHALLDVLVGKNALNEESKEKKREAWWNEIRRGRSAQTSQGFTNKEALKAEVDKTVSLLREKGSYPITSDSFDLCEVLAIDEVPSSEINRIDLGRSSHRSLRILN